MNEHFWEGIMYMAILAFMLLSPKMFLMLWDWWDSRRVRP